MRWLPLTCLVLTLTACGQEDGHEHHEHDEMDESQSTPYSDGMTETTANGHFDVALTLSGGGTVGLHDVTIRVLHADAPAAAQGIEFDAWMPAHGHGTDPVLFQASDETGVFETSGLNLMMPGVWELEVNVLDPDHGDTVMFAVEIE